MKKTLYIHAGMPKTGTTALQYFLVENKAVLEKYNYHYPVFEEKYPGISKNHNGYFLAKKNRIEGKNDIKLAEIKKLFELYDNIILSHEGLWRALGRKADTVFEELRDFCARESFEIKVIVYLRRQDEFLESLWNQKIKIGNLEESTMDWKTWLKHYEDDSMLTYDIQLDKLASILKQENIIVRRYQKSGYYGENLFSDFLFAIGLEYSDEYKMEDNNRNLRLRRNGVEIKRILNTLPELEQNHHAFFREIIAKYESVLPENGVERYFSDGERQQLLEKYEKGNCIVAEKFFGEKELFEMPEKEGLWKMDDSKMTEDIVRFVGIMAKEVCDLREDVNNLKQSTWSFKRKNNQKVKKTGK